MSDDPQIGQDEIEELLRQAQGEAAGKAKPEPTAETPAEPATPPPNDEIAQDDIEALLKGAAANVAQEKPATSTQPPRSSTAAAAAPAAPAAKTQRKVDVDEIAQDDIELLLRQAEAAIASVDQPTAPAKQAQAFRLRDFAGASASAERTTLELIRDVELDLKIELGRTHMPLDEVLRLRKGSVVPLEKLAGDPVDIFVNGRLIARGEVLVMNDNFCVRVAELVASEAVA